ncbi:GTPase [Geopseudomonas aromaticivorans]
MTHAQKKSLSLTEVLQRAFAYSAEDVKPIVNYLKMDESALNLKAKHKTRENAEQIADYLCKMGSNDLATVFRGGKGVDYSEIVYDVGKKLKAPGIDSSKSIESNERAIVEKLFADALDKMSEDEKRALLGSIGITKFDIPYGSAGVIIIQQLAKHYGGFALYKTSLILANMIARAIMGRGLALAANVAITRSIGMALGPIGWIVTGAWLAIDLAGPAYRKTVPAVVHIAMLRQIVTNRISVGVVGDGSVGKDALFKSVFGLDTGNVSPVAGSTSDTQVYEQGDTGAVKLVNFPGFNDIRPDVESLALDHLNHTDVFLMTVDLTRGVSGNDTKMLASLKEFGRPILVCLNKVDLVRPSDKEKLLAAAQQRLQNVPMIETAFDPDPRLHDGGAIGGAEVFDWVKEQLIKAGKETEHLRKGF